MKQLSFIYICTILLLSSFMLSHTTYAAKQKQLFKDVPTHHYAYTAIKWAYDFDIISGYSDGTFRPNQPVSEQQFAQILVNYFDLEPTDDELVKYTKKAVSSDATYDTLAAYEVPLNGYFDNTIREQPITRGVVAQAITYVAEGKATLKDSIRFLVDHHISSGQYPKYEFTNLVKFYGATERLTRAQVVALFYNLQSKKYFSISEEAENSYLNPNEVALNKRANNARNTIDASLRKGKDWSTTPDNNQSKTWNGEYSYFYVYGEGDTDSRGRILKITNSTKTGFDVVYNTFDGKASGTVKGKATITSDTKARMSKTSEGERCIIEFKKQDNSTIKATEFSCEAGRDSGTDYSGVLTK